MNWNPKIKKRSSVAVAFVDFFVQLVNQLILRVELGKWGIGEKHRYQGFFFLV